MKILPKRHEAAKLHHGSTRGHIALGSLKFEAGFQSTNLYGSLMYSADELRLVEVWIQPEKIELHDGNAQDTTTAFLISNFEAHFQSVNRRGFPKAFHEG